MGKKPSLDEVIKYTAEQMKYYLRNYAASVPKEQQEEITQACMIRVFRAYEKLDDEKGWKAFVQKHCFGSVKDYQERGKGFEESGWMHKAAKDKKEGKETGAIFMRDSGPTSESDDDLGSNAIDKIIAFNKQEFEESSEIDQDKINWDLLSRLCSVDKDLHIFVRYHLLDHTLEELTEYFGLTRERIGQKVKSFTDSLDDPDQYENTWIAQIILALGLCEHFHMEEIDHGHGWHLQPVDFTVLEKRFDKDKDIQVGFFDDLDAFPETNNEH